MRAAIHISSPTNSRFRDLLALHRSRDRRSAGLCLVEGQRLIDRAIAAGLSPQVICRCPDLLDDATSRWLDDHRDWVSGAPAVLELTPGLHKSLAQAQSPSGVIAAVSLPSWSLADLEPISDATLLLCAVGIEKPGNLGAMARSADACGCAGMLAVDLPGNPYSLAALRNSTGAMLAMPVVAAPSSDALAWLAQHHVGILAAAVEAANAYDQVSWDGPIAVAVGPEQTSLPDAWVGRGDKPWQGTAIRIPMAGRVTDSLNASTAAAVLLFEAARQKRTNSTHG